MSMFYANFPIIYAQIRLLVDDKKLCKEYFRLVTYLYNQTVPNVFKKVLQRSLPECLLSKLVHRRAVLLAQWLSVLISRCPASSVINALTFHDCG